MVEEIEAYLSPAEAAARLGVTARRVRMLVADGALRSVRVGDRALVRREDVEARAREGSAAEGRPFSPRRAWALILMASGRPVPHLDPVTRSKLRRVLAERDLWSLRARLRRRAERRYLRVHSSDLETIERAPGGIRTGARAAMEAGLGLYAGESPVELYVDRATADDLGRRFALRPSRDPNVILRVVPDEVRSWLDEPLAPRLAMALDLAEDGDPRSEQVAREALSQP